MKITFDELAKMGYDSVTDYCRYLEEKWEPYCPYTLDEPVEVYRGKMLCLTVSSIEEGAKLMVREDTNIGPIFVKYTPPRKMTEKDKERLRLNRQKRAYGQTADALKS